MQQQQTLEQAHLNTARLQEQNDILHKQTVKLQEHTDTLSREVERLSHLERTLHSLQRDHDALHKVHADSQKQLETLKKQIDAKKADQRASVSMSMASLSTPTSAGRAHASVNSSAFDDNPRDYLLGMNIASKDNTMTIKSFAPASVCAGILRAGDSLLSIDGRRIKDVKHLRQICRGVPGTIVSIKYTREPSDEVLEMQLLRSSNAQGQPVLTEYIPCTPRALPPSAAGAGGGGLGRRRWRRR